MPEPEQESRNTPRRHIHLKVGFVSSHATCQFRGIFSDAAGSYAAEWKIINGKSYRTFLTSSKDVLDLFIKNIDPPTFE
jgi:hypothetical protein